MDSRSHAPVLVLSAIEVALVDMLVIGPRRNVSDASATGRVARTIRATKESWAPGAGARARYVTNAASPARPLCRDKHTKSARSFDGQGNVPRQTL